MIKVQSESPGRCNKENLASLVNAELPEDKILQSRRRIQETLKRINVIHPVLPTHSRLEICFLLLKSYPDKRRKILKN